MPSLKSAIKVLRSKSPRYILFRASYEFDRRTGLLARKFPAGEVSSSKFKVSGLPTLNEWRESRTHYLFDSQQDIRVTRCHSVTLTEAIKRILQGEVCFFSHEWKKLGLNWDYVTNPENGYRYNKHQRWTKVNDFNEAAGDIKFVWEPSRFESLYTLVRNDYHNNEDHSEFAIGRIIDWIDKNPLNCGPNYKCSQETSLRVLNWLFALNFYKISEALTEERWQKIITAIYWQIDHVYKNINFSRISVRNNHAITETLTLYLIGLLFPDMPGAKQWKKKGKRWFEEEIEYQFEPDGSYIQQSMNYQRVVTQLLTIGIALAEKNGERLTDVVYERAYANLSFLYQMQDEQSGWLPNYGSNDGALFFQLSDADYRDYRPQLDALHYVLTGEPLYGKLLEDAEWYGVSLSNERKFNPLKRKQGLTSFKDGGYFVVRNGDKMIFIRCGSFKGRVVPDQMHIDVWSNGENVLMDGGSYMYNTDEKTRAYFAGTESANCIMLDDNGQMKKGPRFVWFYPSRILRDELKEKDYNYLFEGCIETFRALGEGIVWHRTIQIKKDLAELEVTDSLDNKPNGVNIRQIWHTKLESVVLKSDGILERKKGWNSDYYGKKEENNQIEFMTDENHITTRIILK